MQSTNIHPQVLLNISQSIIIHSQHLQNYKYQIGILLGYYNPKLNKTDIVDCFECLYKQSNQLDEEEIQFIKERMQLRQKGDKWNLFKNLDILGWYITNPDPAPYANLHSQIAAIVDEGSSENSTNFFKYLICFNRSLTTPTLYEMDSCGNFIKSDHKIEPQSEEMICITSAIYQTSNSASDKYQVRSEQQKGTLNFMEDLLVKLSDSLRDPKIINDPIALRKINELLLSFPQLEKQNLQEEFTKLIMVSYYCALLKMAQSTNSLNMI